MGAWRPVFTLPDSLYWTPRQLLEAAVFTPQVLCRVHVSARRGEQILLSWQEGMVFPKAKQLSSKALVDLVTTRARSSLRAWKMSGGGEAGLGTTRLRGPKGSALGTGFWGGCVSWSVKRRWPRQGTSDDLQGIAGGRLVDHWGRRECGRRKMLGSRQGASESLLGNSPPAWQPDTVHCPG